LNRREIIMRGSGILFLSVAGASTACSQKSVVEWAQTARQALQDALPYFEELLPNSVPTLTKAIKIAIDLEAALRSGSANAFDFIAELIGPSGLVIQILTDVGTISDPQIRSVVSGILAIASIALRVIATELDRGAVDMPRVIVAELKSKHKASSAVVEKIAKSKVLDQVREEVRK
jgi:hypothetical protein